MNRPPEQHELITKQVAPNVEGYNNPHLMQQGCGPGFQPPYPQPGYQQPYPQPGYQQPYPQPGCPPPPGFQQPKVQFMPRPAAIPGVPPGLEYLTQVAQLLVRQQVELLEVVTGWEGENKYQITNTLGQQVYFATEDSNACVRQCCGKQRGFVMHITDNMGQEVMRVRREFKCCAGYNCCACSLCCAYEIQVEAPPGDAIGYARQLQSCTRPRYSILDSQQQEVLYVEGPLCVCEGICCTWDQQFRIMSTDRTQEIGKLTKQWSGFVKEICSDTDNFSATFPMDLDVRLKATLIGTLFLIDFMFFEHQKGGKKNL